MARAKLEDKTLKKSNVEKRLEAAVFGDDSFNDRFNESDEEENYSDGADQAILSEETDQVNHEDLDDNQLFMVDDGTALPILHRSTTDESSDEELPDAHDEDEFVDNGVSIWHDSDDEKLSVSLASVPRLRKLRKTEEEDVVSGLEYARRLRVQFERVYPIPRWALPASKKRKRSQSIDSDVSDAASNDEDTLAIANAADPLKVLLRSSKSYEKSSPSSVRAPGKLNIQRLRDANHQAPSSAAIQTLSFHPTYPLLMTGGYDRTLRIYHIDGKLNTPASSLYLKSVPIESAHFHPDGRRVFIGGRRRYFHIWDLQSGALEKVSRTYGHEGMHSNIVKLSLSTSGTYLALVGASGWVNILSADTAQWLDAFKVTRGVADLVWHTAGDSLTVANIGSEVWEYNVTQRAVVRRWTDEGGTSTTKIAMGGAKDRWMAVGGNSGIVNIYDRLQDSTSATPKAHKVLKNITIAIHDLQFAADGQILAMTGRAKKDVLKMVHLPTCTVFQNWPTQATPLGKVGAVAFSPSAKMFAVGNEAGKVTLWSI